MKRTILYCLCLFLALPLLNAQKDKGKSPAKLAKEAQDLEKTGDFQKAAVYYETAYVQKEDNLEWIYNAGRCFLYVRDYANAAKCLEKVKDQDKNPKMDKPGYKYALALKQSGQYEEAINAFQTFIANYKGADAEALRKVVDTEIKGCNFALKAQDYTTEGISIEHLPSAINTDKVEFAPIAFNDGVLYFSSTSGSNAAIYRTQKVNGNWSRPISPELFAGKMEKPNFGNGAFTPDGKRFYFTQCDLGEYSNPKCAIYAMVEEEDGKWSAPFRLPDYINAEGASTTHPCVVIEGDKEVLYFSSNREGGKGAFDIWYCTRAAGSSGFNFTLPKNLGNNINTVNDEITPFYHTATQTLYFASSGWVNAGGLDIFKSKGSQLKWEIAQNLGFPINSSADDLYYIISESHQGGYLVSNRSLPPSKVATTNDDIFFFGQERIEVTIKGNIRDCNERDESLTLTDVNIKLFEAVDGGEELLENRMLAVGEYKFILQPQKEYVVEVSRDKYADAAFQINTFNFTRTETTTKNICLEIPKATAEKVIIVPLSYNSEANPYTLPTVPPIDKSTGKPYAEGSTVYNEFKDIELIAGPERKLYYDGENGPLKRWNKKEAIAKTDIEPVVTKKATAPDGPIKNFDAEKYNDIKPNVYFKVQVAAVRKIRPNAYDQLKTIAGIKMEQEAIGNGITRIVLVPSDNAQGFNSKAAVLDALSYVQNHTRFKTAFAIVYENGQRLDGDIKGWNEDEE